MKTLETGAQLLERQNLLAGERLQEILSAKVRFGGIAGMAASNEIGRRVAAAEGGGDDVVEGPITGAHFGFTSLGAAPFDILQRGQGRPFGVASLGFASLGVARDRRDTQKPPTVKATMAVALENAGAKFFLSEMVRAGPGARLAGGVAVEWEARRGELRSGGDWREFCENFVGQQDADEAAPRATVDEANAVLAGEDAQIASRRVRGKTGSAGHGAARDADGQTPGEERPANEMVVECAFVGGQAQGGDEAVLDRDPETSGGGMGGHGRRDRRV